MGEGSSLANQVSMTFLRKKKKFKKTRIRRTHNTNPGGIWLPIVTLLEVTREWDPDNDVWEKYGFNIAFGVERREERFLRGGERFGNHLPTADR